MTIKTLKSKLQEIPDCLTITKVHIRTRNEFGMMQNIDYDSATDELTIKIKKNVKKVN
jgi:hypothetical protein